MRTPAAMLLVLLVLLVLLGLGGLGSPELIIWLVLLVAVEIVIFRRGRER
jgi:hypothetical protein